jgi:hypothetical protein
MMTRGKFYKLWFWFISNQSLIAESLNKLRKGKREKKRKKEEKGPGANSGPNR